MDKTQALYQFWNSFGWPALDEQGDYDEKDLADLNIDDRYIMYEVKTGDYSGPVLLTASLFHRSALWEVISQKAQEISDYIGQGLCMQIDNGYIWIKRSNPFAQHMADTQEQTMRRIVLHIEVDFLTST